MVDRLLNADPLSKSARSLFAKMIDRIPMDDHERNMIICKTVGIGDDDLASMIKSSGLCQLRSLAVAQR